MKFRIAARVARVIVALMNGLTHHGRVVVRPPAVAGRFYPGDAEACRDLAQTLLSEATLGDVGASARGAIVPHAGWICGGAIAAEAIKTLAQQTPVDVVVVFGAVHSPARLSVAALDDHHAWQVPGGTTEISEAISKNLVESAGDAFVVDERFHDHEHAVEVEVPFIQQAWPNAMLLPIEVPLIEGAVEIGIRAAQEVIRQKLNAVFLASSDLTHYGPAYGFTPAGVGQQGLDWAKGNDRRLLERISAFDVAGIIPHVMQNLNACGGGAIAAMLAACRELGASTAKVLRHANSCETLAKVAPQPPVDAVSYAAVVVI